MALEAASEIMDAEKCPVKHDTSPANQCPIDRNARSPWDHFFARGQTSPSYKPPQPPSSLSTERETSSIPKSAGENWVYPSEAQFFAAMARKNHHPQAADMRTIVPIHNTVNEHAWAEVMKWEAGRGGEACGGVRLVNFKGRPGDMSPKARLKSLLGYTPPFDRHDWVVDRCGTRLRYIIDFYTGRNPGPGSNNLSFFLDVRPALDNWEGVKMRAERFWDRLFQRIQSSISPASGKPPGNHQ